ncbi:MAG: hypothetical protein COZ18_06260 [Flexibacter sp. CG_4_10_14_3_um_filter_32_15]|nr:MAG: hypothetical protein COZ18_06260 [Flexibacter sp. CG_4_10_14_3_um_filter_32_15]
MNVLIDEKELRDINMTPEEMKLEIAIMLYQKNKFSSGKAAKFAGISRIKFQKELGNRKIPINYTLEDFEKDSKMLV